MKYKGSHSNIDKYKTLKLGFKEVDTITALLNGPMVKRLRHHPFTVVSRVRISVGSPYLLRKAKAFAKGQNYSVKMDLQVKLPPVNMTVKHSRAVYPSIRGVIKYV